MNDRAVRQQFSFDLPPALIAPDSLMDCADHRTQIDLICTPQLMSTSAARAAAERRLVASCSHRARSVL
jgi:hypothetical protein